MSSIRIHQFSGKIADKTVCYQALKLKDQLIIWIGFENDACFKELAMAMNTSYDKFPTPVKLLGDHSSFTSSNMAVRLSKRCQKPVFVSFNIPESSQEIFAQVEERLLEEMTISPDFF